MTARQLTVQLTEQGQPTADPVLRRLVCGQQDGHDKVGGVASGGQRAATLAGLVEWTLIDVLTVQVSLPDGDQPHLREGAVTRSV